MFSAFGVEHTISKSYIPGKGFKAASRLTQAERSAVHNEAQWQKRPEKSARLKQLKGKNQTLIHPGIQTPRGKLTQVEVRAERADDFLGNSNRALQGYSLPNGRGGGHLKVFGDAHNPEEVLRHEKAHLDPNRNAHRFMERRKKSKFRLGREEGRADFTAAGKATPGQYPGNRAFKRGYDNVQNRMAQAKKPPRTFTVSPGGTVREKK